MHEGLYKEKMLVSEGLSLISWRAAEHEPGTGSRSQAIWSENGGTWVCSRGRLAIGARSQGQRLILHLLMSPKAGWEPAWEKTKLLGLVSGYAWLNVSGQEVRGRGLMVLPASPSGKWGFRLWMFGSGKDLLAGRRL